MQTSKNSKCWIPNIWYKIHKKIWLLKVKASLTEQITPTYQVFTNSSWPKKHLHQLFIIDLYNNKDISGDISLQAFYKTPHVIDINFAVTSWYFFYTNLIPQAKTFSTDDNTDLLVKENWQFIVKPTPFTIMALKTGIFYHHILNVQMERMFLKQK